jgi:5-formyltetrahydrofolate cyclo-ligase
LVPGPYGILEPRRDTREYVVPPDDAPVIVPGIAFSPAGHRIGYGKGYYDRFLAAHHGLKLGLAYEMQIVPSIPSDTHDVPVDLVITETATYDCRG